MVMVTEEGSTKIVNFITPEVGVLVLRCGHMLVKIHYFFKNLLLYSKAHIRQTEGKVMMSKEGSTKIINFITPRTGILVLGRCHIVNMQYFFSLVLSIRLSEVIL